MAGDPTSGAISSIRGISICGTVLYDHYVTGRTVAGWTSLMIVVLFFGGIQMIFLGVLGEYLGRVFEEVKQRPLYIVGSLEGFESLPPGTDHSRTSSPDPFRPPHSL